ncbi:MAG: DUF4870 domain-containing protein [Patescibacteria group bacterium]|nr:DUF4870 domain-containing protein [Patescibacteria group bacterium]
MSEDLKATAVPTFDKKDIEDNKALAAVGYIGILCLIPLLAKKESKFAQEHGKQGFVLFLAWVAIWILGMIPVIGWFIIWPLGFIVLTIVSIVGLVKALQGEFWEVPLLGKFRSKVNF